MGVLVAGLCASASAQVAPGIPVAPGPSSTPYSPGGIGPGRVPVAPGPAARGANVRRVGPGGVEIAPGPAGEVSETEIMSTPYVGKKTWRYNRRGKAVYRSGTGKRR
jgi:hypothetical protein